MKTLYGLKRTKGFTFAILGNGLALVTHDEKLRASPLLQTIW
jgi:hypothetical protein